MQMILTVLISFLFLVPGNNSSEIGTTLAESPGSAYAGYADSLKEGDPAPMFVLRDVKTDDAVYLRDYTGKVLREASKNKEHKVVVLSFWSTWCQPCKAEIPRLTKLAGNLKGKPIQFFLVNTMEDRTITDDSIRTVYKSRGYTLQCLLDMTGRIGMRYNARVLPLLVVIDKQGTIRKIMRGFHEDAYADFAGFLQQLAQ
jgi:thiol-disulfide isomerase/thioredoxin